MKKPIVTLFAAITSLVFLLVFAGCQSIERPVAGSAVPMYASSAEAKAVAHGQFGAIPVEISSESDLSLISWSYVSGVAQVRSRSGKVGWVPVDALSAVHLAYPAVSRY